MVVGGGGQLEWGYLEFMGMGCLIVENDRNVWKTVM